MFKTLLIKEIQAAIIDFRFWVVMILCISIIPLCFYVSVKNYSQSLSNYQQEVQTYIDQSQNSIEPFFEAEGVHPPSPLSIFSRGLDNKMPHKVITSRDANYQIEYAKPDNEEDLLGKIDFAFIIAFVLSILALVFTFNSISGDKESGVLRAVLSNSVLRRQILLSKLIGNYLVFSIPFLISMLVALLIVYFSGIVPIFSAKLFSSVLLMIGISMLFLFALFNLGIWMSAFARSSALSINILLLIWIVVGLVIPKVSPIISETIYPVESVSVFEMKKNTLQQNITKEKEKEEANVYDEVLSRIMPGASEREANSSEEFREEYNLSVKPVRDRYEQLLISETDKLTNDYTMRCNRKNNLARNISKLSPIAVVNNLMAEFSSTGYSEADNFMAQAKQYQETVKQNVYNKFTVSVYRSKWGSYTSYANSDENIPVPVLDNYRHLSISQIVQRNWMDIILLIFYSLLFFAGAFISFLRFDVR